MKAKWTEHRGKRSGFTLVEVLLVVAILGILAGVVVGNFARHGDTARIKSTQASISALSVAVQTFQIDLGRYPSSLDELVIDTSEGNWQGPYVLGGKEALVDSWATPLSLTSSLNGFEIRSAGRDRQMGTDKDLTSL